jgi:hypothetical protein
MEGTVHAWIDEWNTRHPYHPTFATEITVVGRQNSVGSKNSKGSDSNGTDFRKSRQIEGIDKVTMNE